MSSQVQKQVNYKVSSHSYHFLEKLPLTKGLRTRIMFFPPAPQIIFERGILELYLSVHLIIFYN